ncbi:MAG: hypothetical protein KKC79_07685 [Gammaproteobacteria bacterium]|nr:hypothetical protein [Gammaproteobacteria bacterium]MBU1442955.1 hypothetical protein [Gammaproteobacteria bacterium]MBU2288277.1 hypothetical protein [Gammaproteobacteria bacterium]MBU2408516.1 hypothetical protein [Gammaproteobacteria bacterium]
MAAIVDAGLQPTTELTAAATRARQLAEQIIVSEFRGFVQGRGTGPTETHLRVFAKLAAVELALVQLPVPQTPLAQLSNSSAATAHLEHGAA